MSGCILKSLELYLKAQGDSEGIFAKIETLKNKYVPAVKMKTVFF